MSSRTKARKRALDALYASGMRNLDPIDLLSEAAVLAGDRQNQEAIFDYAETLVRGFQAHASEIDQEITSYSEGWSLDRMPRVDREILRLAVWEMLFNPDIPHEVAISEAVALAAELSTDDSPKFINGLLARLSKSRQIL